LKDSGRVRVLVVDDEPPAVERMVALLAERPDIELAGCESRADRVIARCRSLKPDAVLLDIEMPGPDGLDLAGEMAELEVPPAVIFVTAHAQYAVEAFGLAAADYLVKPVRRERLLKALRRVRQPEPAVREWVVARIGERRVRIPLDEVRAFTAGDKCTLVHALHQSALLDEPLKAIEARFGARFLRVHRNALVSRDHVRAVFHDGDGIEHVELEGIDLKPEVSRRSRARLREWLENP